MNRRTLFLSQHVLQYQGFYTDPDEADSDCFSLLFGYLYGAAIEAFRPNWIACKRHTTAWEAMSKTFREYERNDVDFAKLAYDLRLFANKNLGQPRSNPVVDMWAIGVIMSNNEKDMKFSVKTLRNYFKSAFPEAKEMQKTVAKAIQKAEVTVERLLKTREITPTEMSLSEIISDVASGIIRTSSDLINDITDTWKCVDTWIILLVGPSSEVFTYEDAWRKTEHDFPGKITKRVVRNLQDLDPTPEACLYCAPEFQTLVTRLYMAKQAKLEIPFEVKDCAIVEDDMATVAEKCVLPALAIMQAQGEKLKADAARAADTQKELEGTVADLEAELETARTFEALATQARNLQKQLAAAQQEAKAAQDSCQRLGDRLTKALNKNNRLEASLEESELQRKELDNELAELMESRDEMFQPDLEEELANPSGVRERIGEDAYQLLCGKKLSIIGGHSNTHTILRELFPHWQYYACETVIRDPSWAVDAIVCITTYMAHKNYKVAKERARAKGVQFICIPHNAPTAICQYLVEHLDGPKEDRETA